MKRKDLYEYIRQEIINELTTVTKSTSTEEIPDIAKIEKTTPAIVQKAVNTAKATGKEVNIAETDLEEMARTPKNLVLGPKFETAKKIFDKGIKAQILAKVEEMGEEGISQLNLALALGKKSQPEINPYVRELTMVGALTTAAAKEEPVAEPVAVEKPQEPEVTKVEKPESEFFSLTGDEEVDSDEERATEKEVEKEEEPVEKEPPVAVLKKTDKELEFSKEKIETINKVKTIAAKIENMSKGPEREKKILALKQFIKNNKALLRGYTTSELTNGLIS